jgi:Arc/MetJ-type ribon-helix-helix transcriptional regulator
VHAAGRFCLRLASCAPSGRNFAWASGGLFFRRGSLTTGETRGYVGSMKVKTSITLTEDLLKVIDEQSGPHKNRSDFIEKAVRAYVAQVMRDRLNARDLDIINRQADRLNQEAEDVLTYQALP